MVDDQAEGERRRQTTGDLARDVGLLDLHLHFRLSIVFSEVVSSSKATRAYSTRYRSMLTREHFQA